MATPLNNSTGLETNNSSLGVPLTPDDALSTINVVLTHELARQVFNPTQLFFNLYRCLAFYWKLQSVRIITIPRTFSTPDYPQHLIVVAPISGNRLFTSTVAAAVLDLLLREVALSGLNPEFFVAELTTRGFPAIPIGQIRTGYRSYTGATEIFSPLERNLTLNANALARRKSKENSIAQSLTVRNSHITVRVVLEGRHSFYGPITPSVWLTSFYRISYLLFRRTSSHQVSNNPDHPSLLAAIAHNFRHDYRLRANLITERVPAGKSPLVWSEVVDGVVAVLEQVIAAQRFEPFYAKIYKHDWEAATFHLWQGPITDPNREILRLSRRTSYQA